MREIKFKAWDKLAKKWMDPPIVDGANGKAMAFSPLDGDFVRCFSDSEVELVQYTGLKDKNGTEIYEGDIYHMGDPQITYTVVWHDSGLIGKQNGSSSYAGLSHWKDRIEIIGNIHENPELLEVTE